MKDESEGYGDKIYEQWSAMNLGECMHYIQNAPMSPLTRQATNKLMRRLDGLGWGEAEAAIKGAEIHRSKMLQEGESKLAQDADNVIVFLRNWQNFLFGEDEGTAPE